MLKALDSWYDNLCDFMPPDTLHEALRSDVTPEQEILQLPSDFPLSSYERLGLIGLAETKYLLRTGQAHDALKKLRDALGLKGFLVKRKYNSADGQRTLLRSETEICRADKVVRKWAEVYRRNWEALGRLREPGDHNDHGRGILKELKEDDLVMLSSWMDEHRHWQVKGETSEGIAAKKGGGKRELPWIWKLEFGRDVSGDEVKIAVDEWTTEGKQLILSMPP